MVRTQRPWEAILNRSLSVYLDLMRLIAALMVIIAHGGQVFHISMPDILGHSAKEGVAIFFVLSGFVIAFVTDGKERDWRSFAKARAIRMISVIPIAIVVLIICYLIGTAVNPAAYGLVTDAPANPGATGAAPTLATLLRYLTFTNELWLDHLTISTGSPFWSLGFEVAYYIGFAIFIYSKGRMRIALLILWALTYGPRILLAFPLWLTGVAAWHLVKRVGQRQNIAGGILSLVLIASIALLIKQRFGPVAIPLFEWGSTRRLASSYSYYISLCVLFSISLVIFAVFLSRTLIWPSWIERSVRFLAGSSFTIYIAHLPVMVLIAAMMEESAGPALRSSGIVVTLALSIFLAELGERRKSAYSNVIGKIGLITILHRSNKLVQSIKSRLPESL